MSYFAHSKHAQSITPTRRWYHISYSSLKYILPISTICFIIAYNKDYIKWELVQFVSERRSRRRFLANNEYFQKYQTRPPGYTGSMMDLQERREPVSFIPRTMFRIKMWIAENEGKLDYILNPQSKTENRETIYENLRVNRR